MAIRRRRDTEFARPFVTAGRPPHSIVTPQPPPGVARALWPLCSPPPPRPPGSPCPPPPRRLSCALYLMLNNETRACVCSGHAPTGFTRAPVGSTASAGCDERTSPGEVPAGHVSVPACVGGPAGSGWDRRGCALGRKPGDRESRGGGGRAGSQNSAGPLDGGLSFPDFMSCSGNGFMCVTMTTDHEGVPSSTLCPHPSEDFPSFTRLTASA